MILPRGLGRSRKIWHRKLRQNDLIKPCGAYMTPPRSIEEQFEPDVALGLRSLEARLEAARTTGRASDYFVLEAVACLDRGLLLATLQLVTAALELRARELLVQYMIAAAKPPARRGVAGQIQISVEENRSYLFCGILSALEAVALIDGKERSQLKRIYQKIRIPLHHGIVSRYSRRGNAAEDGLVLGDDAILDALWEVYRGHHTTSETDMESIMEDYAVEDLGRVVTGLELLTSKFIRSKFFPDVAV